MTLQKARERLLEFTGDVESDDPKARRRRQILEAATELFVSQGYRKTSVDEIAERAGIAKGTIYLYYKNKNQLFFGAVSLEKLENLHRWEFFFDEELSATERIRRWLTEMTLLGESMPLVGRLLHGDRELAAAMADAPPELNEQLAFDRKKFLRDIIDDLVAPRRLEEDEARERVSVLEALVYTAPKIGGSQFLGGLSPRRFAGAFAEMVIGGLRSHRLPPMLGGRPRPDDATANQETGEETGEEPGEETGQEPGEEPTAPSAAPRRDANPHEES